MLHLKQTSLSNVTSKYYLQAKSIKINLQPEVIYKYMQKKAS